MVLGRRRPFNTTTAARARIGDGDGDGGGGGDGDGGGAVAAALRPVMRRSSALMTRWSTTGSSHSCG